MEQKTTKVRQTCNSSNIRCVSGQPRLIRFRHLVRHTSHRQG